MLLAIILERVCSKVAEIQADQYAVTHATEKELQGGIRFFNAIGGKPNIVEGLFLAHPSPRQRIRQLKSELKDKFGYDSDDLKAIKNSPNVEQLRNYFAAM